MFTLWYRPRMGVDLAGRLDWATNPSAATQKRDWWLQTLIRTGLAASHTIVIIPVPRSGERGCNYALFVVSKSEEERIMAAIKQERNRTGANEGSPVLCAGGCGQALSPSEVRNGQKTRKGHGRGNCPGVTSFQDAATGMELTEKGPEPTMPPPEVVSRPMPSWGAANERDANTSKERPRIEDVLYALRWLHLVDHMTYPIGNGRWNVHLEGELVGEAKEILKQFLLSEER